ncbi:30S ribosomal protein S6 [Candidatus Tachikawaea gelatinosa]|uniref:Small ribosomal subunit protein bS6 n=1 Tax=Candidatus Tachikawaea gelatinosa TaxID=1410383 RepID=A0A090BWB2_9ENTR|nr:30S ribosomal protein S6 [Candidatus Tachikawaea gelatinosa]BAP58301.1 30S ribosomal protein S6 [Candidatus Tachikawaea gelatinosa]
MQHYEIVFLIHPDKSDQVKKIIEKYTTYITSKQGIIHRLEDWGRRQLSYSIKKLNKAHYILINIETKKNIVQELSKNFSFDDSIIRHIIIKAKSAHTDISPILKFKEERRENLIHESNNVIKLSTHV